MTKHDGNLANYRTLLMKKLTELQTVSADREDIAIDRSADEIDQIQRASERDMAIRNLDRNTKLLRNIRAALRRIEQGTYGYCVHCDEEISPKRLAAVPWAALCLACQEAADRHDASTLQSLSLEEAA